MIWFARCGETQEEVRSVIIELITQPEIKQNLVDVANSVIKDENVYNQFKLFSTRALDSPEMKQKMSGFFYKVFIKSITPMYFQTKEADSEDEIEAAAAK